jgi:hypothetical protein
MCRVIAIALLGMLLGVLFVPGEARASACTDLCGDSFSDCLVGGRDRETCWAYWRDCISLCNHRCFRKHGKQYQMQRKFRGMQYLDFCGKRHIP